MRVGILGAGIAGLSCAWLLKQRGIDSVVFERRDFVGGLARSFEWQGFNCDFASHRLFTLDEALLRQLISLVPMGRHVRRSSIFLRGKWMGDPISVLEIGRRFSPVITGRLAWSYLVRQKNERPRSFNDYVDALYGRAMNEFAFKSYTERLFGIPGDDIDVEWARNKIRLAGFADVLRENSKKKFSYFYYPLHGGYGAIARALGSAIASQVRLNTRVTALETDGNRITAVISKHGHEIRRDEFDIVISTMPMTILGRMLGRRVPLSFRPVHTVYLHIRKAYASDNHWVYFMDPGYIVNRMVEFKNMSPFDCPPDSSVLCAEVTATSYDITTRVVDDLVRSRFLSSGDVVDTMEMVEPFGYPVYSRAYQQTVTDTRVLFARYQNLFLIGRSAEFEHKEVDDNFATALSVTKQIADQAEPLQLSSPEVQFQVDTESNPEIYVVILAFNNVHDTIECIESVKRQVGVAMRIVVVDNGSTDDTPQTLRERFAEISVLETGRNLGVPWGYNYGFVAALRSGAEYILMLNNDTVLAPDAAAHLLQSMRDNPRAAIAMPKVVYYDAPNMIWAAGARRRLFPPAIVSIGNGLDANTKLAEPQNIEYAISCALLIHRRAFEAAGLFDPGYFFYFDDWDFSQRVRAHGLDIRFVPKAHIAHKISRSTKRSGHMQSFYQVYGESATRFYRRHGSPVMISLPLHIAYIMGREIIRGNWRWVGAFAVGVRLGLNKPLGAIPTLADAQVPQSEILFDTTERGV
ncbi:MAG: FAD-dependent oxidoreductase [Chloroflexi bacterium]|nr:FAD-dependent oxidoreductase [Chloroflexota bacterium]